MGMDVRCEALVHRHTATRTSGDNTRDNVKTTKGQLNVRGLRPAWVWGPAALCGLPVVQIRARVSKAVVAVRRQRVDAVARVGRAVNEVA